MFQYLAENGGDLVAIKTSGKIGKEDLDRLLPEVEERIKQYGKINFYWEMDAFEGWEPISFLRDRLFEIKHLNSFKKIAIVGAKEWEEKLANVMKPFTTAQLKYFNIGQRQEALAWLKEG